GRRLRGDLPGNRRRTAPDQRAVQPRASLRLSRGPSHGRRRRGAAGGRGSADRIRRLAHAPDRGRNTHAPRSESLMHIGPVKPLAFAPKPVALRSRDGRAVNALSIDVEEHFQVQAMAGCIAREAWETKASRVEMSTNRALD